MPISYCIDCNTSFWREDAENWKTRCFKCWKKESKSPNNKLRPQNNKEVEKLQKDVRMLLDERLALIDENAVLQEDLANIFQYISFLIFACHPDRVPGREGVAHEVMVWLNAKREQIRGR
jgi:hypothetical protein